MCSSLYCRFKQLMEQEAKKKQQREEEKRKVEEASTKANNHEQTVQGGNQVVNDLVKNSQSVADDIDPSISGVINGNSKDLEGNQNSTSTYDTANDEGSAHLNAVNKKNLEKVLLHIYRTCS
jgi:YidC/Oxa1 family membrane protein insertase